MEMTEEKMIREEYIERHARKESETEAPALDGCTVVRLNIGPALYTRMESKADAMGLSINDLIGAALGDFLKKREKAKTEEENGYEIARRMHLEKENATLKFERDTLESENRLLTSMVDARDDRIALLEKALINKCLAEEV